eukprot:SAG31_NODE_5246_length_2652_cov_2.610262_1_plen_78_part_00
MSVEGVSSAFMALLEDAFDLVSEYLRQIDTVRDLIVTDPGEAALRRRCSRSRAEARSSTSCREARCREQRVMLPVVR